MVGAYFARRLRTWFGSRTTTPTVTVRPWEPSHAGNFDADEEAYTLYVDGRRTDISFAIEDEDIPPHGTTNTTITLPNYVAQHGVDIEPSPLDTEE